MSARLSSPRATSAVGLAHGQERIGLDELPAGCLAHALAQQKGVARAEHHDDAIACFDLLGDARADEEIPPVPGGEQVHARLFVAASEAKHVSIEILRPSNA